MHLNCALTPTGAPRNLASALLARRGGAVLPPRLPRHLLRRRSDTGAWQARLRIGARTRRFHRKNPIAAVRTLRAGRAGGVTPRAAFFLPSLAGGGAERSALDLASGLARRGIPVDVALSGFRIDPFAWMARARVFALSSSWEECPNVLVQAMACGAPVVSADCPTGPDEILEGGKWGRLVPVGDPAALAAAIRDTLDAPAPPELLQARAGAWSAEAAVDRYAELLAEPAEERR